jgi:hypothetical protein
MTWVRRASEVPRGELGCTVGEEARLVRLGAEGEGEEMTDEVDRVLDLVRVVVDGSEDAESHDLSRESEVSNDLNSRGTAERTSP